MSYVERAESIFRQSRDRARTTGGTIAKTPNFNQCATSLSRYLFEKLFKLSHFPGAINESTNPLNKTGQYAAENLLAIMFTNRRRRNLITISLSNEKG